MTTIKLNNLSTKLTAHDFADLRWGMQAFARQVATDWGLGFVSVTPLAVPGAWQVNIVDDLTPGHDGILGYHEKVDGVVTAWISASATMGLAAPFRSPFGTITPEISVDGVQTMPEQLYPGSLSEVLAHEIAEALIDPNVNLWARDSAGKFWLLEIADHADGGRYVLTVGSRRVQMIVPDYTLPSFYDVNGVPPFSRLGLVPAPFTLASGAAYAFEVPGGTGSMVNQGADQS